MANNFCRFLSNGYKINVENDQLLWSPCCFYTKRIPLATTSEFQSELAYTSSATDWLPECKTCQLMEISDPVESPRLSSFNRIPVTANTGECSALEISFDTKCNAACLSCSDYSSTTWLKYENKHRVIKKDIEYHPDKLLDQLIATVDLRTVREIFIMGGEPFYSDTNLKLLKYLDQHHPALDQVILKYQTNGSIIPSDDVKSMWSKFRAVHVHISIDGIGEQFNYLRWPLKWHRVERTIDDLLATTTVLFRSTTTISPLNVLYFQEIENWFLNKIPKSRLLSQDIPITINRCFSPLNLGVCSEEMREHIKTIYGSDHTISKILDTLELDKNHQQMIAYIGKHDSLRRLNWRKTFPDAVKFLTVPTNNISIHSQ